MTHMETLAEICNILKVEMLEDHVQRKSEQLSSFQVIVAEMLEDVQERLVYRTQVRATILPLKVRERTLEQCLRILL